MSLIVVEGWFWLVGVPSTPSPNPKLSRELAEAAREAGKPGRRTSGISIFLSKDIMRVGDGLEVGCWHYGNNIYLQRRKMIKISKIACHLSPPSLHGNYSILYNCFIRKVVTFLKIFSVNVNIIFLRKYLFEEGKPITCLFTRLIKPSSLPHRAVTGLLLTSVWEICTLSLHLRNLPPSIQRTWTNMRPPILKVLPLRFFWCGRLPKEVQGTSAGSFNNLVFRSSFSAFLITVNCSQIQTLEIFWLVFAVLYVIILSAALDLVPPSTPKGIIAFCNIAPALVAKVGWPYFLKGRIQYTKRLIGCCVLSFLGMIVSGALCLENKTNSPS